MSEDTYYEVKNYFSKDERVVVNSGKGAQGIKYKGKMFTMFFKGDLMVKLSEERVEQLNKEGIGEKYPHSKDRVVISVDHKDRWIEFVEESLEYVIK